MLPCAGSTWVAVDLLLVYSPLAAALPMDESKRRVVLGFGAGFRFGVGFRGLGFWGLG